jgi:FkbM family methyltransferase
MSISTKIAGARAIMAFDNWPALLLGRLLHRSAGLLVYRKDNLEILIDHRGGDENGTRACIVSSMYRRYVPLLNLGRPANVLDIGANGGGFPLMLKLSGVQLASVVCIEMNPATYSRLLLNVQSNLGFSAVAINAAVCGTGSEPEIFLRPSRGGTGYNIIGDHIAGEASPHVAVKTTTLESLCARHFRGQSVDICKIDIEGAEYDVLSSTCDDLLRSIRYLFIEFHDPVKTPAVIRRFAQLGFADITDENQRRTSERTEVQVFRGPQAI